MRESCPVAEPLRWSGGAVTTDGSSAARVRALTERLTIDADLAPGGTVLLVAGQGRTGWTVTLAAALLRDHGAAAVLPLVAHQHP